MSTTTNQKQPTQRQLKLNLKNKSLFAQFEITKERVRMSIPLDSKLTTDEHLLVNETVTKVVSIQKNMNQSQVVTKEGFAGILFLTGVVFTVGCVTYFLTASLDWNNSQNQTQQLEQAQ